MYIQARKYGLGRSILRIMHGVMGLFGLFYHSMLSHNISYEIVLNCYWAITLISRVHVLMGYTDIQGALYGGIH